MLLAELDLRLQPVLGLIESLNNERCFRFQCGANWHRPAPAGTGRRGSRRGGWAGYGAGALNAPT